jgi:hypothetical protein
MNSSKHLPSASSFVGHVRNGVIVPDVAVPLNEGQAVRVEPVNEGMETESAQQRVERIARLQQLFDAWTEEDSQLSDEEAGRLQIALEQNRGLSFRSPQLD